MTQQEFETRTGKEVTSGCFDYANRVYMAAGEMDKDAFCEDYFRNKVHQSAIVLVLVQEVEALQQQIKNLKEGLDGALQLQDNLSYFIADMAHLAFNAIGNGAELRKKAIKILGKRDYLKYIISKGYELEQYDRDLLLNILSE